jgi:hypothetical protein
LFKGGFRAITGKIGKKNKVNYRITTPVTTIGIRGTDHETYVVMPENAASSTPIGTYNKVNLGETSMTTEKGSVFVLPNQMGFVGAPDQMPQLQPINLNIFTVTTQPALKSSSENHGGKLEGSQKGVKEIHETSTMDKDGMRDTATVDKINFNETPTMESGGVEGVAKQQSTSEEATTSTPVSEHSTTLAPISEDVTSFTPSTEDAVKNTIPTTTDDVLEQNH